MFAAPASQPPPPWPQGLTPRRAPVLPRVRDHVSAQPTRLEDHVAALLAAKAKGVINLHGPAGSGKTVALEHLAAIVGPRSDLFFADNRFPGWVGAAAANGLVLFTSRERSTAAFLATFEMAPWTRDEWIEYLLALHRPRCASVMNRLLNGSGDPSAIPPLPELWRPLLDILAADDGIPDAGHALRRLLHAQAGDPGVRTVLDAFCLGLLTEKKVPVDADELVNHAPDALRLAAHRPVQVFFAAEAIVDDLEAKKKCRYFGAGLEPDLVREVAILVKDRSRATLHLEQLLRGHDRDIHPAAAGILLAADPAWRPAGGIPRLAGAALAGIQWRSISLPGVNLSGADLRRADLADARLPDATLRGADLARATLARAWIEAADAASANFDQADLSGVRADLINLTASTLRAACLRRGTFKGASFCNADLTDARLVGADLTRARLNDATIARADFTDARLDEADLAGLPLRAAASVRGASFYSACLVNCDLQGMHFDGNDFRQARIAGADLTATRFRDVNLASAHLRGAGLADVDWEFCNLADADLRDASFHLGSTRAGLVPGCDDLPASEGTRTGFYTDDYGDLIHLPPEQIRKANLRGVNLRGARVEETDFYLVDLREALYTEDQREHFLDCRAILD